METLNKQYLVKMIAIDADLTQAAAEKALNAMTENIRKTLKNGDALQLKGFGTFKTVHREARIARNPLTNKPVNVPAKDVGKFTFSEKFFS